MAENKKTAGGRPAAQKTEKQESSAIVTKFKAKSQGCQGISRLRQKIKARLPWWSRLLGQEAAQRIYDQLKLRGL